MDPGAPAGSTRGDTTRDALIQAAIEIFGRDGFAAASTRAISEAAGVNQALISYHFGGKPGLYLAALKLIADSVVARIGPLLSAIEAELAASEDAATDEESAQRARALLHELTDAFVKMLTSDESAAWARLILREQQDPSEGFDVLYYGIMHRMLGVATRLVARCRRDDATSDACKLTAITILGQALVFRAARAAVLREMGWARLTPDEIEAIQTQVRRNATSILEGQTSRCA
jgi:AcrR family transcriptional regulator